MVTTSCRKSSSVQSSPTESRSSDLKLKPLPPDPFRHQNSAIAPERAAKRLSKQGTRSSRGLLGTWRQGADLVGHPTLCGPTREVPILPRSQVKQMTQKDAREERVRI